MDAKIAKVNMQGSTSTTEIPPDILRQAIGLVNSCEKRNLQSLVVKLVKKIRTEGIANETAVIVISDDEEDEEERDPPTKTSTGATEGKATIKKRRRTISNVDQTLNELKDCVKQLISSGNSEIDSHQLVASSTITKLGTKYDTTEKLEEAAVSCWKLEEDMYTAMGNTFVHYVNLHRSYTDVYENEAKLDSQLTERQFKSMYIIHR